MLWNLFSAVAEEAGTVDANETATTSGLIETVIMMVAMVAIFYFFLIRPQRKKDKQVKNMLAAIKAGDRICTIGGLYGTVTNAKDDKTLTITMGTLQNSIVIARWAVKSVEDAPLENDKEPEI